MKKTVLIAHLERILKRNEDLRERGVHTLKWATEHGGIRNAWYEPPQDKPEKEVLK